MSQKIDELKQAIRNYFHLGLNTIPVGYRHFVDIVLEACLDEVCAQRLIERWGVDYLSKFRSLLKAPTFSASIREELRTNFHQCKEPPSLFAVVGKRTATNKNAYEFYYKEKQTAEEVQKIWQAYLPFASGIAILCGEVSDISVVDFDEVEELVDLLNKHGFSCTQDTVEEVLLSAFPENAIVKTFRGYHVYFKYDPRLENRKGVQDYKHIDLKIKDGYVLAPPSVAGIEFVNGQVQICYYTFLRELNETTRNAGLPAWFLNFLTQTQPTATTVTTPAQPLALLPPNLKEFIVQQITPYWRQGHRNQLCFSLAGLLRRGGVNEAEALNIVQTICELTQDEEKKERLRTVRYEYRLPLNDLTKQCAGARKFLEAATNAGMPIDIARLIVNRVYNLKVSTDLTSWFQDYNQLAKNISALLKNDLVYHVKEDTFYVFNESSLCWNEVEDSHAFYFVMTAAFQLRDELEEVIRLQHGEEIPKQTWTALNKLMNDAFIKHNVFQRVKQYISVNCPMPCVPPDIAEGLPAEVGRITFHRDGALLWLKNGDTKFIPLSEQPHRRMFALQTAQSEVGENADPAAFENFVQDLVEDKETAEFLL